MTWNSDTMSVIVARWAHDRTTDRPTADQDLRLGCVDPEGRRLLMLGDEIPAHTASKYQHPKDSI